MGFRDIKKSALREAIMNKKDVLKKDVIITCISKTYLYEEHIAVRDLLEVEICQKRKIAYPKISGTKENDEDVYELLFDHLVFGTPNELLRALPSFKASPDELDQILREKINREVVKVKKLSLLPKIYLEDDNEKVTPTITIIELKESELKNYISYTGRNAEDEIGKKWVLKKNEEFVVDGSTGEKIYRLTRTQFLEDKPRDIFIENKVLESEYVQLASVINLNKNIQEPRRTYLFFDTETTGLPRNYSAPISDINNWPRLVQLAYLLYDENGNQISKNNFIIKPNGFQIPSASSAIHRITNDRALIEGKEIIDVLDDFFSLIKNADYIVAHNLAFDEKIIGAEFFRANYSDPFLNKNKICTMESTIRFCAIPGQKGYKWPKLSDLYYKLFKKSFNEAHNAAYDIQATAKCYWELKRLGKI